MANKIVYHASPVQDIKRFRLSEDTSGNGKGKVIFASKYPEFASAFGVRWNDANARLKTETNKISMPTEDNLKKVVLYYTDEISLDSPCSMYKLKSDFDYLRYKKDLELYTNKTPDIISEEKFDSFRDMAKKYSRHRKLACIVKGIDEVDVYFGKYNGNAEDDAKNNLLDLSRRKSMEIILKSLKAIGVVSNGK